MKTEKGNPDISIGYACLAVGVPNTEQRSCILKNATGEKLAEIIGHNLDALEKIMEYNSRNGIRLFRISSDLIPFGSSPVNQLDWDRMFERRFQAIGGQIRTGGIRVSMHPGQYTVLNSPDPGVVERAVDDLRYHCRVLSALGADASAKIILHVGGIYNDKKTAVKRFTTNWRQLDDGIKRRLVIENDDKCFNIADILEISAATGIPAIYDNLHNAVKPADPAADDLYWIKECAATWSAGDGAQKIHYSQQNPNKKPGSHTGTIAIDGFLDFYRRIDGRCVDIMLEVKDKNLSAVKCILCTTPVRQIRNIETEWGRYKYAVLERSPSAYSRIRELLKDKSGYPAVEFYRLVEEALGSEITAGNAVNAAQHVWGYFKDIADAKEKQAIEKDLALLAGSQSSSAAIKRKLWKLAVKYNSAYLLDSLYFIL